MTLSTLANESNCKVLNFVCDGQLNTFCQNYIKVRSLTHQTTESPLLIPPNAPRPPRLRQPNKTPLYRIRQLHNCTSIFCRFSPPTRRRRRRRRRGSCEIR